MKLVPLKWDSSFFERSVARLDVSDVDTFDEVFSSIKSSSFELIYLFVSSSITQISSEQLHSLGAIHYDTKCVYEKNITSCVAETALLSTASQIDSDLELLAYESGSLSRFNLDPQLHASFKPLYWEWLKKDFETGVIFIEQSGNKTIGMATVTIQDKRAKIGLVAVDNTYRNLGIGKRLIQHACHYAYEHACQICEVATQGENRGACHLYESCGFVCAHKVDIWHYWKDQV